MPLSPEQEAKLFLEAIALAPAERGAFLASLSLPPEDLRHLERLWTEEDPTGEHLEQIVRQEMSAWAGTTNIQPGDRIGRFHILEPLGHGGTGDVYLVEFEEAGSLRQAALKLIRPGLLPASQWAVWNRERRYSALVNHPYIALLIEAGAIDSGGPFLLMEYVEGQRIDQYSQSLPLDATVRLFDKVCEAVAAAHRKLVVHRDLKPANILVRADGLPKLLDFGIAEVIGNPQQPLDAATRSYASPEQLAGKACTTASDVYSLGIILAKLIGADAPADLKAIASKASQPDPDHRYEGVPELRTDLQRWLNRLPVPAYSQSPGYRLRCLLRRHWLVSAAALIALAGISLALALAWQQYQKAHQRFGQLRQLASVAIFDFDDSIRNLPGALPARQLVLENALKYLSNLEQAAQEDPSVLEDLASAYQKVAFLQMSGSNASLDHYRASLSNLKRSFDLRTRLRHTLRKDPKTRTAYATLLTQLAALSRATMDVPGSEAYLDQALTYTREWNKENPDSSQALEALIYAELEQTRRLRRQGPQAALDQQRIVANLLENLRRKSGPTPSTLKLTGDIYRTLGLLETGTHHKREAIAAFQKSIQAGVEWHSHHPGIPTIRGLANSYYDAILGLLQFAPDTLALVQSYERSHNALINRPDLPDPQADFWVQHRLNLQSAQAHLAVALGQREAAEQKLEALARALDQVIQGGEGAFWASVERVRIATTLAQLRRPRR